VLIKKVINIVADSKVTQFATISKEIKVTTCRDITKEVKSAMLNK
jgi:hypothetical protein